MGPSAGGQANFTPPVQQVSIWALAHNVDYNGSLWTGDGYLQAYDVHGNQLDQNQVQFIPKSPSDFDSWHQLTYTSSSNNIAFARFSSSIPTHAIPFDSEFDDLCAAPSVTTVITPFGNVLTGCDSAASPPPPPKPAPSASIGATPGRTPGATLTSSAVQGHTVHTAAR